MTDKTKLYLVVRADLPDGLQAAQLVHVAIEVCFAATKAIAAWRSASATVACLAAPNELELARHAQETAARGLQVTLFHEPDLDGQLTAFVVLGEGLFPSLPCALRPICSGCGEPRYKCACDRYVLNGGLSRTR